MVDISKIDDSALTQAQNSLKRVQSFDVNSLIRSEELGKYAFRGVADPAQKIVNLFQILSAEHLEFFPEQQLDIIKNTADDFHKLLSSFLEFDVAHATPSVDEAQTALVESLKNKYQKVFNQLLPLISFAAARSQDYAALAQQAKKAFDDTTTNATTLMSELNSHNEAAETTLQEIRNVAAEQGVGKQAIHFKNEADDHATQSRIWMKRTMWASLVLGLYAIASLFIHNIPGTLTGEYGAFQLAVSKVLIFGVITYIVVLFSRNFLSHEHNRIVNKHRQNALATFTALAEATSDAASSDIVLSHAASCIFSPQETGYTKGGGEGSEKVPGLQIIPRIGASSSSSL
ncbi:MAG: hypothetical protein V7676_00970 [Parasphingorhabdus sp.]|uniref:hypothetical protein n=1 Tax=Parasphingorhabdus sp. TaxID=2709688 RepID=UPI0030019CD8